jgi:hypothetical protein
MHARQVNTIIVIGDSVLITRKVKSVNTNIMLSSPLDTLIDQIQRLAK